MTNTTRFPKLIAFDLDYTLWDLWIDTHVDGPLKRNKNTINQVLDRYNQPISFYRHVADIFHRIRATRLDPSDPNEKVVTAACSRTHAPDLANQALRLLLVPPPANPDEYPGAFTEPTPAIQFFDELEIYPGTYSYFSSSSEVQSLANSR
ncbi:hypothetical protein CC2G_004574 [Coprinopsis cinerea AmutBmut pab1-1]|nr:hypothetical protein CC2G_004574 [Coprinopsis cinerea AmutBmut pab1-1]